VSDLAYRNVAVSGDECASLREMERLFRRLSQAAGSARYADFADTLYNLARRHERAGQILSLRSDILGPPRAASVVSLDEARSRRHLSVGRGGSVA
jgi:hypothetical protein